MAPPLFSDIFISRCLVVGSGIAGLQFALLAAEQGTVNVVTKKESRESNTNYAQGGIAAAVSPRDDFFHHVNDTLTAGDGLCNEEVVTQMVTAGPRLIERLLSYGVRFSKEDGEEFALGREGGHSRRRVLHCQDLTGREIEERLLEACLAHPNISVDENHMGLDLLTGSQIGLSGDNQKRIVGCMVLDRQTHRRRAFLADAVVLATGGCGKVYSYTSNPDIATGDGLAMAYRAGAELRNLEFVQFHPTCLYHAKAKSFLISEAVRGEGAVLINGRDETFMERYHPLKDLAPRDVVARSIDKELKTSGDPCVYLDLRHLNRKAVEDRFPNLVKQCAKFGLDMAGQPVPVVPAAHYMCGGVAVDLTARTSLNGLYAIGETACTGVHGANRLASNSLLEAVFFADRASSGMENLPSLISADGFEFDLSALGAETKSTGPQIMVLEHDWDSVRRIMWDYVGIVRDRDRLDIALRRLRQIRDTVEGLFRKSVVNPDIVELRNISLLAELIVLCARDRHESRGLHFTPDFPGKLKAAMDTIIKRNQVLAGEKSHEPKKGLS